MLAIAAVIVATGVVACGIPVKRALRIQPIEAVRAEG
jgi:ABC-type antimicrobial peptide transport system permease subunit